MSKQLYTEQNSPVPKLLFASDVDAVIKTIVMSPGEGTVEMGSIVYRDAAGLYLAAAAADVVAGKDLCVLNETADTGADNENVGTVANAIFGGVLIAENLTLKDGVPLTDAMKLTLRGLGIHTKSYIDGEGKAPEKNITVGG